MRMILISKFRKFANNISSINNLINKKKQQQITQVEQWEKINTGVVCVTEIS